MSERSYFLDAKELEEFRTPGRFFARTVSRKAASPNEAPDGQAVPLVDTIRARIKNLQQKEVVRGWFQGFCVEVKQGDGASWSAERLATELGTIFPTFHVVPLSDRLASAGLPVIESLVGRRRFLDSVARKDLSPDIPKNRPWVRVLAVLALLVVGVGVKVASVLGKPLDQQGPSEIFRDPGLFFWAALSVVLGWVGPQFMALIKTRRSSQGLKGLRETIESQADTLPFANFVEDVAKRLTATRFPRIIVVDSFERLDLTTRQVIVRYFSSRSAEGTGSELWVVFEGDTGERLSSFAVEQRRGHGFQRTWLFEQQLLSDDDRRALAEMIRKPDRAHYETVKTIASTGAPWASTLLHDHLAAHPRDPDKYHLVDLLYLLAMSSEHGRVPFGFDAMVSELSREHPLRQRALEAFLPGIKLTKSDVRVRLTELQRRFGPFFSNEDSSAGRRPVTIRPVALETLEENGHGFGLPDPHLGHFFWVSYWFDKLQNHALEAFWIRKLSHHLTSCQPSNIADLPWGDKALELLGEASVYALNGAIRACVFEPVPLLAETIRAVQELVDRPSQRRTARLERALWEAFSVTGDSKVLEVFLEVVASRRVEVEEPRAEDLGPASFFFGCLDLAQERRDVLWHYIESRPEESERTSGLVTYSTIKGGLLATVLLHAATEVGHSTHAALVECIRDLPGRLDKLRDRLGAGDREELSISDMSATSHALLLAPHYILDAALMGDGAPSDHTGGEDHLRALLDLAEHATLLAADRVDTTRPPGPALSLSAELVVETMKRELCVSAAASLWYLLARHHASGSTDSKSTRRITEILEVAFAVIDLDPDLLTRFDHHEKESLFRSVRENLRSLGFLWSRFRLEALADFVRVQELLVVANARRFEIGSERDDRALLEGVAGTLNRGSYSGLLANLAAARIFPDRTELRNHFIRRAADLAVDGSTDFRIKRELSMAALQSSHHLGVPLDSYLEVLTEGRGDQPSYLEAHLAGLPDDNLERIGLVLRNTAESARDAKFGGQVRAMLAGRYSRVRDDDLARQLRGLLDVWELSDRVRRGDKLASEEVLANWRGDRDSWIYADLLALLLRCDRGEQRVASESADLLTKTDPRAGYTAYMWLAFALVLRGDGAAASDTVACEFLSRAVAHWDDKLSVEACLELYELLLDRYPTRKSYEVMVERLHRARLHRDELTTLRSLMSNGKYFLLFRYYFRLLSRWGLTADMSREELDHELATGEKERRTQVEGWLGRGGVVPDPLVADEGESVVSSEFLIVGRALFEKPMIEAANLDGERRGFDQKARSGIFELLRLGVRLQSVPLFLRDLLAAHSMRFLRYTPV